MDENVTRNERGAFAAVITDDQLWAQYELTPSTQKVAHALGLSPRQVRERLAKIRHEKGKVVTAASPDAAGALEKLLASVPSVDPTTGAAVTEISVNLHEGFMKDEFLQVPVKVGMDGVRAKYVLDRASLFTFTPHESHIVPYIPTGIRPANVERVFCVGDQQIGFWAVHDPAHPKSVRFTPFHDERSIDVMMQALAVYQPDRVVIVGDFVDLPQLSRFAKEPEFERTMQASMQEAYDLLRKIRDTVGADCKMDFVPGNHETRLVRAVGQSADTRGLYGLTRPGDKYPLHHIATILKFDDLNIECAAEYPSGEVWLAKRRGSIPGLVVTHADPKRKDMRADSIHGHLVLPALETRQVFYEDGPLTYTRICVSGCGNYSDTGDKVRLTRTNTPSGRSRMSAVPSFATVDIDRETGLRHYGLHIIHDGALQFEGKVLTSHIELEGAA